MRKKAVEDDRLDSTPRINEHVTTRFMNDEAFIMDLRNVKTFSLNETAARVWSFIDNENTVRDIIGSVLAEYDVPGDVGRKAVLEILDRFRAENLIIYPDLHE
ncbi:MAG: PqqD family protein [Candidatus Latescibacteria bacterium]|nr:PqqD family protein [Candidatus Latescibacterota bacterium]